MKTTWTPAQRDALQSFGRGGFVSTEELMAAWPGLKLLGGYHLSERLERAFGLFYVIDMGDRETVRVYLARGRTILEADAWLEQESVRAASKAAP